MKTVLNIFISAAVIMIACDAERNACSDNLNYTNSITLIPFLLIAIYLRIKDYEHSN